MKLNFKYMIVVGLLIGMTGCDDNLETFEIGGSTAAPTAIATSAVNSYPLPGQIKLTWNTPSEGAFEYLQIKYHDPLPPEHHNTGKQNPASSTECYHHRKGKKKQSFSFS